MTRPEVAGPSAPAWERHQSLATIIRLLRHPVWRNVPTEQGGGLGVLLVPGFGCADWTLAVTSKWLRSRGYRPAGTGTRLNLGCTTQLVDRIERRLEEHADLTGGRVVVLGQSRGGWLGRLAAVRSPDLVRGLVMVSSPVLDPLGAKHSVIQGARFLARLTALGVPGLLDGDCFDGSCFSVNSTALAAGLPADVPALAVYSRFDATVPWRLCQDPAAEWVEIPSSHTAMALHPAFYVAVEPRLAEWARAGRRAYGRNQLAS